jgi:GH15 family glucan-1,4-alpha-glucosidase
VQGRIEDYALIGDCETAALVSRSGSIDWLCWPRFDSPACFAALLGAPENGRWIVAPSDPNAKVSRRYRDGTLILETEFETADGAATLIDFMPPRNSGSDIVRHVVGKRGRVDFHVELVIRLDYGRTVPWVNRLDDGTLRAIAGPDLLALRSPVQLRGEDMRSVGSFTVSAGETVPFVLSYHDSVAELPPPFESDKALVDTQTFWREFSDRCPDVGRWTEQVKRSLITLKALTYAPTGGIVAAATTSLPEWIGGERNWDYRFCWLRDATFALLAFMHLGYYEEAVAWRDWLMRAIAGAPDQLQILYGVAGERWLPEREVPWLAGYGGSLPVRVGNAASEQVQLDVFGEMADAMTQASKSGIEPHPRAREIALAFGKHLAQIWSEPDEGIWEVRGGRRHFTHSKVMAWVAFDRLAVRRAEAGEDDTGWRQLADAVHRDVCEHGFDAELNSFVQSYGSKHLDASLLMLPLVGFLPPEDPRIKGTVAAIENSLLRDGFVLRYDTEETGVDGLPPGEGVFLACSFWLADNYVLLGRYDDAETLFNRLLGVCNDVGLLAEEFDPHAKQMLGNFPQAFSHVGLINTALNLARSRGPVHERSEGAEGMEGELTDRAAHA